LFKIFILALLYISLFGDTLLKNSYYTNTNDINISNIIKINNKDVKLHTFYGNEHSFTISSKKLIKILQQNGYTDIKTKYTYVKFHKRSPIDTTDIKNKIINFYKHYYKNIEITDIEIHPRGYISKLPKRYKTVIKTSNLKTNKSTIYIKTPQKQKIFFDYCLYAKIYIFVAKKDIKKAQQISLVNATQRVVMLDRFRALPLQNIQADKIQAKHHIKKDSIITIRDIQTLDMVKRDKMINVNLDSGGICITFVAKALQNGKLNDIITIQKSDGKRLKATVIGKNRVEIR